MLPLKLEAESERAFEKYASLDRGAVSWVASTEEFYRGKDAVATWLLGASCNLAVRRDVLDDPFVGPFDQALGPGTAAKAGEDIYLFYRILQAGYSMAYAADAVVRHAHRSEESALEVQLHGYYAGHTAYQLTTLLRDRDLRALKQGRTIIRLVAENSLPGIGDTAEAPPAVRRAMRRGYIGGLVGVIRAQLHDADADDRQEFLRVPRGQSNLPEGSAVQVGTSDDKDTTVS